MRYIIFILLMMAVQVNAQQYPDSVLPVRGLAIAAPSSQAVDSFVQFIKNELIPRKLNTLILRVDYNYQYLSHPELRDKNALSKAEVKKIVTVCQSGGIRIIPQINLLGHQSWAETTLNLLRIYPQFDETPHVKMPAKYKWPNDDGLYCKSYCPLHPDVHKIVFAMVDEICEVFEANAFHTGMDEVFYIGDEKCPRCKGEDRAKLFADEVARIRNHLFLANRELWIWGDRLLDGDVTGLGMWEASTNATYPAIDMIPKDVVICDWHYERPDKTAVYFSMKGFKVVTCPWRNPEFALVQLQDMINFREHATPQMKKNFYGVVQTVWSGATPFMRGFYQDSKDASGGQNTPWHSFKAIFGAIESH